MTDKPINLKALQPIFDDKYLDRKRKARLRAREHYKKNRVKILARRSQYRKTNPVVQAYDKQYYENNKERIKVNYDRYHDKHRDEINARARKRRREKKLKC